MEKIGVDHDTITTLVGAKTEKARHTARYPVSGKFIPQAEKNANDRLAVVGLGPNRHPRNAA